jgi:hypothetical protein
LLDALLPGNHAFRCSHEGGRPTEPCDNDDDDEDDDDDDDDDDVCGFNTFYAYSRDLQAGLTDDSQTIGPLLLKMCALI